MTRLRLIHDQPCDVSDALARAEALWGAVGAEKQEQAGLYCAPLTGQTVVLGRHQHRPSAVQLEGAPTLARRSTGGAALLAGEGVLYSALCLQHASALMDCPRGRILNRYVRGFLQGLRRVQSPAYYFGRDWLSLTDARPGGSLGWTQAADGRVLVEAFIGVKAGFALPDDLDGYPERDEPRFRGKQPMTVEQACGGELELRALAQELGHGHAEAFKCDPVEEALSQGELAAAEDLARGAQQQQHDLDLSWSSPRQEAIGFVQAGVQVDPVGVLRKLTLAGDFFQEQAAEQALRSELIDRAPTPERIGYALDRVYGAAGHVIEGIRSLQTLRDSIREAVERAAS